MNKAFQKCWQLTLIVMLLIFCNGLFVWIPVFSKNIYLFMAFGELLMLIPIYLGCRYLKRHGQTVDFGFRRFSPFLLIPLFFLPACMQHFFTICTFPLQNFLVHLFGEIPESIPVASNVTEFLWQFAAICVVAPVVEELLCRGVMMQLLRPYGLTVALLTSAVAFSVLHFDVRQLPVIFFLGLLLGVIRLLTKSVWACVFAHSANNLCSLLLQALLAKSEGFAVLSVLGAILFPFLLVLFLRKMRKHYARLQIERVQTARVSASFVICMVFVFLYNTMVFLGY